MKLLKLSIVLLCLSCAVPGQTVPRTLSELFGSLSRNEARPEAWRKQVAARVLPSLVRIEAVNETGQTSGFGSGFIVRRDGWIATNHHVIAGATKLRVRFVQSQKVYEAVGVGPFQKDSDWAMVKIDASELPTLEVAAQAPGQGETVLAFGNPSGLDGSMTEGIISRVSRADSIVLLQHTAPLAGGSSGGPLVNQRGQVVGVNTAILKEAAGFGFAVGIDALPSVSSLRRETLVQVATASGAEAKSAGERKFAWARKYSAPEGWTEARLSRTLSNGELQEILMFASPDAERADITGWLSSGIRLVTEFPKQGNTYNVSSADAWILDKAKHLVKAYDEVELISEKPLGDGTTAKGRLVVVRGKKASHLSEPEYCAMVWLLEADKSTEIEFTAPESKRKNFESMVSEFTK